LISETKIGADNDLTTRLCRISSSTTRKEAYHVLRDLKSLLSSTSSGIDTDVPHSSTPEKTILIQRKGHESVKKCGEQEKKLFHPLIVVVV
jgi:hypothetical protein